MNKFKFGLIGAGWSANSIASAIDEINNVEISAICASTENSAQNFAEKYGIKEFYTDYKKLCENQDLDAVILSLPHNLLYEVSKFALEKDLNILIEKPMCTSLEQAKDLVLFAKNTDKKIGVYFELRYFDSLQKAKQILDSGILGKVLQVKSEVFFRRDPHYFQNTWRGKWELEGGGSLINQSIHEVDKMIFLLGRVEKVFGLYDVKVHNIETEDNTCSAFKFKNGAFGTMQTSISIKTPYAPKLSIFGSEGAIVVNNSVLTLIIGENEPINYDFRQLNMTSKALKKRAHIKYILDYVKSINNGNNPPISGEDGLKALEFVLAVYESSKNMKIVHLG